MASILPKKLIAVVVIAVVGDRLWRLAEAQRIIRETRQAWSHQ